MYNNHTLPPIDYSAYELKSRFHSCFNRMIGPVRKLTVRRLNPPFQLNNQGNNEANNRIEISDKSLPPLKSVYLWIQGYILKAERVPNRVDGEIYLNYFHRKLLKVMPGNALSVYPYTIDSGELTVKKIVLEVNNLRSRSTVNLNDLIENAKLMMHFRKEFLGHVIKLGQSVTMNYENDGLIFHCLELDADKDYGMIDDHVVIQFKITSNKPFFFSEEDGSPKRSLSPIKVDNPFQSNYRRSASISNVRTPSRKRPQRVTEKQRSVSIKRDQNLWKKDINLEELGIGGLDKQFRELFRRAFISRLFPSEIIEQCGIKHVKGVILYGPPGTGKTLLARKIGEILGCDQIKIVNGPELLNRFVGQSEENVRNLFAEAELEYREKGERSGLHLIILDEMDALCKARGTHTSVAVHDSIVNQLLTKMDGIDCLNNVLMIGMTNRLDLLDPALLRPGRFELQLEITLPTSEGRLKILQIHTKQLKEHHLLDVNINLEHYAKKSVNFTGAELEALVKSAVAYSLTRFRANNFDYINQKGIMVTADDFDHAFKEIKPAFGYHMSPERLRTLYAPYGLVAYNQEFVNLNRAIDQWVVETKAMSGRKSTLLFLGNKACGSTALAMTTGLNLQSCFFRLIAQEHLIGLSELEKCRYLESVFRDAEKSDSSTIVLDSLERLVGYCEIGNRYQGEILQTLISLISGPSKSDRKLNIIGTINLEFKTLFSDLIGLFTSKYLIPLLKTSELPEELVSKISCGPANFNVTNLLIGIKNVVETLERLDGLNVTGRLNSLFRTKNIIL